MNFIRSLMISLSFYVWTVAMAILCIILLLPFPVGWTIRVQEWWSDGLIWCFRVFGGIDVEIRGKENVPTGPAIVAAKHQSAWDTIVFHTFLDKPAIVLKKELLKIPLYGAHCRKAGMIPVDRSAKASALRELLQASRRTIEQGRPILIFPEGTRFPPGEMGELAPGIAGLYSQLGVPVVPVVLNSGIYWPKRSFMRKPGTIIVEFLPAIEPGMKRKEFMALLENQLREHSDALLAEAGPGTTPVDKSPVDSVD